MREGGLGAPGLLIGEHDVADGEVFPVAVREQFGCRAEGETHPCGVRDDAVGAGGALVDDEASTYGVVSPLVEHPAVVGKGVEHHAVGVRGQGLAPVQHQVGIGVEADLELAGQEQGVAVSYLRDPAVGPVGVHGGGILILEAEHDCLVRAVPVAGRAERPEQFGPHSADGGQ